VFFATDRAPGKVDVYDTLTGLWSAIDLPEHQYFVTATTVGNKVYFAGGWVNDPAFRLLNVVDIYDNATGTWSTTSSLSQPTGEVGSIYVNGKIYWAGGVIGYNAANDRFMTTCKVEIRDVSTGSSSFTYLSAPRDFEGNDSKPIYYNNKIIFQGVDIYDPQSSTWSIGQFPQNVFIGSVILANNALYAIGNNTNSSGSSLSPQILKLQY
jgi:N-acetylneuraminic acid mutarotase